MIEEKDFRHKRSIHPKERVPGNQNSLNKKRKAEELGRTKHRS